jgi:hypothetical protein
MTLWLLITRLGEAQILLPAAGLALLLLAQRQDSRAAALRWASRWAWARWSPR